MTSNDYDRALNDRDWAPPGGCSRNEHDAVSRQFAADFAGALLAAIAEVGDLAYYVRSVLECNIHRPASLSRAALYAHYVPEEGPGCYPIDVWLEPPLSFNVEAQADMLVGALKRHRREVMGR
jgi:hypothetical protein